VVFNGSNSNWIPIRAGVPQGSILNSLLFITFINDIVNEINAEIKLFADDTSLYLIVDNPNDTAFLLSQDLNQIHRWSEKWLVKFNPNKTESIVISSKRSKPYHPLYK
jgi:ABC-type antimicrobial peptide transport system ATPase subunit